VDNGAWVQAKVTEKGWTVEIEQDAVLRFLAEYACHHVISERFTRLADSMASRKEAS
jgi:hypothetical protein